MLAIPGMTVAAPKNGREMLGLLRTAAGHSSGPFAFRYPRDATPDIVPPITEVEAVPYGTWEILREGAGSRDTGGGLAILAVGTMVLPAVAAAEMLAAEGISPTVVNCRFMKPHDDAMLRSVLAENKYVLVVEEGTVVNGFGSHMSSVITAIDPAVRVMAQGVPDRFIEQAPRARQLADIGLDAAGIAARARVLRQADARGPRLRAG
jgi:1-deoxy-D-xylulose-5-phosphate synthase